MDPLKNNARLEAAIQSAIDTAVQAIHQQQSHHDSGSKHRSSCAHAVAATAAVVVARRPPTQLALPTPWWSMSPEFAMYHGVAIELNSFQDTALTYGDSTIEHTAVEQQAHLQKAAARLKGRIAELHKERKERRRRVRSSRKRIQGGVMLEMHRESANFHRNSLFAVSARLQWCRNMSDTLAIQSHMLCQSNPELSALMAEQMQRSNEAALAAEEAAMESKMYDGSSDEEDEGIEERPSKIPRME